MCESTEKLPSSPRLRNELIAAKAGLRVFKAIKEWTFKGNSTLMLSSY